MYQNASRHLPLQILAASLLLAITSCEPAEPAEPTEASTLPPAPTAAEVVTFELPDGTPVSWWDGSTIVYVPGGEYVMGDAEAIEGDNIPAHRVSVGSFWIHRIEVTNRMYSQCVAAGLCQPPTADPYYPNHYPMAEYANHPVASVTWQDADDYCTWIGGRLPSEAEWEWAARGESGDPYPWGEQDPNCSRLNFLGCTPLGITARVGSYPLGLSPFNVADMAGNVFEWVNDRYGEDYYAASPAENPTGPESGEFRVFRSSSFRSEAESLPVTLRFHQDPESGQADLGFRCILSGEAVGNPPAPVCTTLSYEPIPRQPPSIPAQGPESPAFSLDVYCHLEDSGYQYGSAVLEFEAGTDVANLEISSPQGTLNCTPDANNPLLFTCVGSALQPGHTATIEACHGLQQASAQTCPCSIEGLVAAQEGNHLRVNWSAAPPQCADKVMLQLECDGVHVTSITLPGAQTELVIDDCPQPFTNQKVCVSCIDPDGNPGVPACSELANPQSATPVCPVFYVFDPSTNQCEYRPFGLVQCSPPDVVVPGYGCLPAPQSGECPVGYYEADYNGQPVCVPVGGPMCQGPLCMAACPEGLVFNEALFCCEYPPDMAPVCPAGSIFDPDHDTCVSHLLLSTGCTSITVTVPDCTPEQPGPMGCWVTSVTGGRYCADPCPAGVPNTDPCTP